MQLQSVYVNNSRNHTVGFVGFVLLVFFTLSPNFATARCTPNPNSPTIVPLSGIEYDKALKIISEQESDYQEFLSNVGPVQKIIKADVNNDKKVDYLVIAKSAAPEIIFEWNVFDDKGRMISYGGELHGQDEKLDVVKTCEKFYLRFSNSKSDTLLKAFSAR